MLRIHKFRENYTHAQHAQAHQSHHTHMCGTHFDNKQALCKLILFDLNINSSHVFQGMIDMAHHHHQCMIEATIDSADEIL